jgi:hypothetical protein
VSEAAAEARSICPAQYQAISSLLYAILLRGVGVRARAPACRVGDDARASEAKVKVKAKANRIGIGPCPELGEQSPE